MQYDKIFSYIEAGKQAGAKCVLGGEKRPSKGYYVDPTSKLLLFACSRRMLRGANGATNAAQSLWM